MDLAVLMASFLCELHQTMNVIVGNIGTEYIDQITIAPGLVIRKQSIGAANEVNCISLPYIYIEIHRRFSYQL